MSARDLPLRQMDKTIRKRAGEKTDPAALGPDEMRLYSYYRPGLVEGLYEITAVQSIDDDSLVVRNTKSTGNTGTDAPQQFQVVVPRFSLDPDLINSYYPPNGHQDEGRVLPHIVLNDPHYPWEILAGSTTGMNTPTDWDESKQLHRSCAPWIALVTFDPEDLRFTNQAELTRLTKQTDLMQQDPKGQFSMSVSDYLNLSSRINHYEAGDSQLFAAMKDTPGNINVIFPTQQMCKDIFAYDSTALEAHKYLAHVRHINTIGFPDAGVEEDGLFSIVVSSRLGQFSKDQPQTQICHLVSIEHIDTMSTACQWTAGGSARIGMVSLFSWVYTALPPNPVNFVATMKNLVTNQQMLRVDDSVWKQVQAKAPTDGKTLAQSSDILVNRLKQGYTIARWRTQSGEETAAFNRGPLVPGLIPSPVANDFPDCSNTSQDYQTLDPQTGLMDLSYSSAWQLGKLLAISDTTFSAALMRFRSAAHNSSVHQTHILSSRLSPRKNVVQDLGAVVTNVKNQSTTSATDPSRYAPPTATLVASILQDPILNALLQATLTDSIWNNASSGQDANGRGQEIYNEFNLDKGNNSDWAIIHAWIAEKLCLGGIPPQYLLPESSYLQPESLRFFHIDDTWLDCFLDGALSVANHLDSDDDTTRREIKNTFNVYLSTPVPGAGYKPQIPSYGFFIRSKLIQAMPDLRITVQWKPIKDAQGTVVQDDRAPVCRWTKWDPQTLMCLLDRQPEELAKITLAQPPHQQRFSLGSYVGKDGAGLPLVEFQLRKLYTSPDTPVEWPPSGGFTLPNDQAVFNGWLNFPTRVMKVRQMALDINSHLQFGNATTDKMYYKDGTANSCELGLELNDPSYYFTIVPPTTTSSFQPTQTMQRKRQLYVKAAATKSMSVDDAKKQYLAAAKARAPPIPQPASKAPPFTPEPQNPPSQSSSENPQPNPIATPPQIATRGQPIALSRLAPFFAKSSGPLTAKVNFQLRGIYPDYKQLPKRLSGNVYNIDDVVPTRNKYLFDLVFSIQKINNSVADLVRIDIDIPTARPESEKPKRDPTKPFVQDPNARPALLEANYYGAGPRMLSNQRFTPFLFFNETRDKKSGLGNMHIELRPRSAQDGFTLKLNDRKTSEVSFRLAEVPVSQLEVLTNEVIVDDKSNPPVRKTLSVEKVEVTMTEWYSTIAYPLGEPVSTTYQVIKRAIQEDKAWG